jgi:hypothetical protein
VRCDGGAKKLQRQRIRGRGLVDKVEKSVQSEDRKLKA